MKAAGYFNGKPSTLASNPGFPDEHQLELSSKMADQLTTRGNHYVP